jgi:hypothetical protein
MTRDEFEEYVRCEGAHIVSAISKHEYVEATQAAKELQRLALDFIQQRKEREVQRTRKTGRAA